MVNKDTLSVYKLLGGVCKQEWLAKIIKCLSETKCTADSVSKFHLVMQCSQMGPYFTGLVPKRDFSPNLLPRESLKVPGTFHLQFFLGSYLSYWMNIDLFLYSIQLFLSILLCYCLLKASL